MEKVLMILSCIIGLIIISLLVIPVFIDINTNKDTNKLIDKILNDKLKLEEKLLLVELFIRGKDKLDKEDICEIRNILGIDEEDKEH